MTLEAAFAAPVHQPTVQLVVYWDGSTASDETAYLLSASGAETMDDMAMAHPREATVVLDNISNRYTPGYTASPIYAYTTHAGQRARLYLGYDGTTALVGTYVVRQLTVNPDERTATIRLTDAMEDYANLLVTLTPTANLPLSSAITQLMASAGLGTASYSAGAYAGTALYAYAKQAPLLQELWQVAVAEGGRSYLDEYGVLIMQNRATRQAQLRAPVAQLVASQVAYASSGARGGDPTNRLVITFEDRITETTPEPVFSSAATIQVDSGVYITTAVLKDEYQPKQAPCPDGIRYNGTFYPCGTWYQPVLPGGPLYDDNGNYIGNAPGNPNDAYTVTSVWSPGQVRLTVRPQDMTRWRSNIPIDYSSVTFTMDAYHNAAGTGTKLVTNQLSDNSPTLALGTVVEYWYSGAGTVSASGWPVAANELYLYNTTDSTVYVTALEMQALPSRKTGAYEIVAEDPEAIAQNLGRKVERRLANSYMGNPTIAQQRANELLWMITSKRTALQLPQLDGAPFLRPGDAFTYVDDVGAVGGTASLQVLENRWQYGTEGYTAAITTIPALDAASLAASAATVPPTGTAVVTSARTGPFSWAAAGTPLYWSQGTWQ